MSDERSYPAGVHAGLTPNNRTWRPRRRLGAQLTNAPGLTSTSTRNATGAITISRRAADARYGTIAYDDSLGSCLARAGEAWRDGGGVCATVRVVAFVELA